MSRPACCKSTFELLYLLVAANGRIENVCTWLRTVAISSDKASPRKSRFLSEIAFCNGSTAIDLGLAELTCGTERRLACQKTRDSRIATMTATAPRATLR